MTILTHKPKDWIAETVVIRWISAQPCISHGRFPPKFSKCTKSCINLFERARWTPFMFNLPLFLTSAALSKKKIRERGCSLGLVETKQFVPWTLVRKVVWSLRVHWDEGSVSSQCQTCFPVFTGHRGRRRVCEADNILQQISCFWANPRLILGKALFCSKKKKKQRLKEHERRFRFLGFFSYFKDLAHRSGDVLPVIGK